MKPVAGRTRVSFSKPRAGSRGFTLAELMIAMLAGLLIAVTAFSFSKQATLSFAREARVASAQMSVLAGFQRLQADVARASYMSSTNFVRDASFNRVCGYGAAAWNATVRAGIEITVQGSQGAPKVTALPDGNFPDRIRVIGNLTNSEAYRALAVVPNGAGTDVVLAANEGPMARSGFDIYSDPSGTMFATTFRPGRLIRLVDKQGRQYFGVIGSITWGAQPTITTAQALPMQADSPMCGIIGIGTDSLVNVINIVDYGITNLSQIANIAYTNTIYSSVATTLGDDTRTELVRREFLLDGTSPVNFFQDPTAEVVAEYAVDLRFGLWTSNTGIAGCTTPALGVRYCPPSTAGITQVMMPGNSFMTQAVGPESVRGVQVRLVTRSREVDRSANLPPVNTAGGAILRYQVGTLGWARTRTIVADVSLSNQRGGAW